MGPLLGLLGLAGIVIGVVNLLGLGPTFRIHSRKRDVAASFEAGRNADLETVIDTALGWSAPPSMD